VLGCLQCSAWPAPIRTKHLSDAIDCAGCWQAICQAAQATGCKEEEATGNSSTAQTTCCPTHASTEAQVCYLQPMYTLFVTSIRAMAKRNRISATTVLPSSRCSAAQPERFAAAPMICSAASGTLTDSTHCCMHCCCAGLQVLSSSKQSSGDSAVRQTVVHHLQTVRTAMCAEARTVC
jgi:hypothetical protein